MSASSGTRQTGPVVRLTLQALPDDVPVPARLRFLLKFALRTCGLRCAAVEWLDGQGFRPTHFDRFKEE